MDLVNKIRLKSKEAYLRLKEKEIEVLNHLLKEEIIREIKTLKTKQQSEIADKCLEILEIINNE